MRILAIETSCDETAISIIYAKRTPSSGRENGKSASHKPSIKYRRPQVKILSNIVSSQIKLHAKWGGVVPNLARREHEKNLIPVLKKALKEAKILDISSRDSPWTGFQGVTLRKILEREPELLRRSLKEFPKIKTPKVDAIAVTYGPGLEPALWAGINFAKALAYLWNKPLIPINHMEGHILSALLPQNRESTKHEARSTKKSFQFPVISLLVSGGHTELVLIKKWLDYKIIGETRDDAVGEAFDKVARMLNLGYPGGPKISHLAENYKPTAISYKLSLPRPMINSGDLDFSFSGLKTAVLYKIKELKEAKDSGAKDHKLNKTTISSICHEFQEAVVDVLVSKTINAAKKYKAKTIIIGGGVASNTRLRERLKESSAENSVDLILPPKELSTDNAVMIAMAAYLRIIGVKNPAIKDISKLKANGNLRLR
ncbi:MAG: tRNA (adenosine(37)-N6)-threonylcarbamoyltransferase complex transferase subunit TsaD [Parcubacteria group bacterium]|nr:tRNA (adenosine(37)-N6)-threonylcarbamoyltransferase complex transferase subunit TsaD [Parcubacteria group bacterium]MCR4342922.1 tRNA (adenosine(37)-N6)-threonylcarbamoyltransferase complex transferase subunit TsaD [Patescibacteria group bacterium]